MSIAYEAMMFAREVHKDQRRKYTKNPYTDHLAEVAGIAMSVGWREPTIHPDKFMAVCWLHDCVEDQGVELSDIEARFGFDVALGVSGLSDVETGNRAERKAASRARLALCSGWIQTIKCADLISNTSSIVMHDPKFAAVYLEEKRLLLDVLTKADPRLRALAYEQAATLPSHPTGPAMTEDDVRRIVREELDRRFGRQTMVGQTQLPEIGPAFSGSSHGFVCGICGGPAQGWNLVDLARGRRNVPGGVEYHCREAAD